MTTALVTGASRGIGLAVARALAGAGKGVIMVARTEGELTERAREIGATPVVADVADPESVEQLVTSLPTPPVILVNNAGLFAIASLEQTTTDVFTGSLRTNLIAPFLLARALLPGMRKAGRGHIVTIGSIADRNTFPGNAAYAASKHGARAMHEVLREELRGSGIRASLVSPGPVDTPLWDPIDPDSREGFTPRARMLQPEAVADAVLWVVTRPVDTNVDELRLSRT